MRILIIGPDIPTPWHISSYTSQWLHFLPRALEAQCVEITHHPRYQAGDDSDAYIERVLSAADGCDAILAPGVRYWTSVPKVIPDTLRKRFYGWVTQIHDGSMLDSGHCDMTFTVRDDAWRFKGNKSRMERHKRFNTHVGWAANESLFYPEQGEELNIFVDHAAFDCSGVDHSLTVQMSLKHLARPFTAHTLDDNGIKNIDPDDIHVEPYHRTPVPATEFAQQLRKAHIFIVTHRESLGLCVLEAAKCGALVLAPENTIAPDRLETVNHQIYGSRIDWYQVLKGVNPKANAERVVDCSWDNVATRIIDKLREPCLR